MRLLLLLLLFTSALDAQRRKGERPAPEEIVVGVAAGPVTIDSINRRWLASNSQIRYRLDLAEKAGKNGAATKWVDMPRVPGGRKGKFRLIVSDHKLLAASGYLMRKKTIRPGTMFQTITWGYANPKKEQNIYLDLRFADVPATARVEFGDTKSEHLEDVERAARIEIFALSAAAVPPGLRLLSASVIPSTARPGAEIELVMRYSLQGTGDAEVDETRRLLSGANELAKFEEKVRRGSGEFTSTQKIRIPETLPPGAYSFQALVAAGGLSAEGAASFTVR